MDRGVTYMLVGAKHGVQLAISLWSLRSYYDGPVALIVGNDAAQEIAERLCQDPRAQPIEMIRWDAPVGGGKGLQHCNKTHIHRLSPFEEWVFLDCDTLVTGGINQLFPREGTEEIVLTHFANWRSNDDKIKRRTEKYRELVPTLVARSHGNGYPAINTGTFGMSRRSRKYVRSWKRLSHRMPTFMCDELVAQLIFLDFPHRVLDERWNCCPVYSLPRFGPDTERFNDVRIWHGHGWKFIKRKAGREHQPTAGNQIWLPWYDDAVRQNFGGLADWTPGADGKLNRLLQQRAEHHATT